MPLICLGINHNTALIAVRERIAVNEEQLKTSLRDNLAKTQAEEVVIISTCNRMEIYAICPEPTVMIDWLAAHFVVPKVELLPILYQYHGQQAAKQLLRVACGLDSMIMGEPQILGQLKRAFAIADEMRTVGKQLGHLFPFVFSAAKKIRTDTDIGVNPVSVAYVAVTLAKRIFADFAKTQVLLIGAGETMQLVATHLGDLGIATMMVANRTLERGQALASQFAARAITIGDIPQYLPTIDIVVSSTASQLPILGKGLLERMAKQRRHRPLLMIDLAVPRDIEPEAAQLADVYLYNIDDLQGIVAENLRDRQLAAEQAEAIIDNQLQHFRHWQQSLSAVSSVCAYREQAEKVCEQLLHNALQDLQKNKPAEEVVQRLARGLTNKLTHHPSIAMRRASYEGKHELLQWAEQLLGIEKTHETTNTE